MSPNSFGLFYGLIQFYIKICRDFKVNRVTLGEGVGEGSLVSGTGAGASSLGSNSPSGV